MANVLRRMEWTAMSPDQRDALCRR
ncbi:MAG: hypothetical protein RLZZ526_995, partial [Actinomycetota bacterium]